MSDLEAERRAIARELHDGAIQHLTAASLRLQSALAGDVLSPASVRLALAEMDEAGTELRALMARLRGGPGTE
jgi:signal transduction histidine kinase